MLQEMPEEIDVSSISVEEQSSQLRLLASMAVFLAVFSQILFQTADNVILAMLVSMGLALPYMILLVQRQFVFSKVIGIYCAFAVFTCLSVIWNPWGRQVEGSDFRRLVIVSIFLVILYSLFRRLRCFGALRLAYTAGIWFNALLFLTNTGQGTFGLTWYDNRFQGTFQNSNELGIMALMGVIFAFRDTRDKRTWIKLLSWMTVSLGSLLILASGSKKGIVALFFVLLFLVPLSFGSLSLKERIQGFALLLVCWLGGYLFYEELHIDQVVEMVTFRFETFVEALNAGSSNTRPSSTRERGYLIEMGFKGFFERPIAGFGISAFSLTPGHGGLYAHNNFLELLYNGGIIGFSLFYSMYYFLVRNVLRLQRKVMKFQLLLPVVLLLVFDMALVSYVYKFTLYVLIYILAVSEHEVETEERVAFLIEAGQQGELPIVAEEDGQGE